MRTQDNNEIKSLESALNSLINEGATHDIWKTIAMVNEKDNSSKACKKFMTELMDPQEGNSIELFEEFLSVLKKEKAELTEMAKILHDKKDEILKPAFHLNEAFISSFGISAITRFFGGTEHDIQNNTFDYGFNRFNLGLWLALKNGYTETVRVFVKLLLESSFKNEKKQCFLATTGLWYALNNGHEDTAREFIGLVHKSTLNNEFKEEHTKPIKDYLDVRDEVNNSSLPNEDTKTNENYLHVTDVLKAMAARSDKIQELTSAVDNNGKTHDPDQKNQSSCDNEETQNYKC
ncbi:MAG: hypothetical protein CMF55_02185 [Legionellales bacterium]|nr:hypothetical protein [Legionellales bacterium]